MPQGNAHMAIFDFVTKQIVYEAFGVLWDACPDYGYSPYIDCFSPMWVSWLNAISFLITGVVNEQPNAGDYVVTLTDGMYIETRLPAVERGISPDRQHILLLNAAGEYSIYNVFSQQNHIITQALSELYNMSFTWQSDDTLFVSLYSSEDALIEYGVWRIAYRYG